MSSPTALSLYREERYARPIRRRDGFLHPRHFGFEDPPLEVAVPVIVTKAERHDAVLLEFELARSTQREAALQA